MNSNKQIIGKYNTLHRILADQDLVIEPPMYEQSLKFSITGVQHQLQDIRIVATKCIVELYKAMGGKVRDSFTELRPVQIESIENVALNFHSRVPAHFGWPRATYLMVMWAVGLDLSKLVEKALCVCV